jgi:hypothetical protein
MPAHRHDWAAGDTPKSVAKHYGIAWDDIWNYRDNEALRSRFKPDRIPPGMTVWLPDKKVLAAEKKLKEVFVLKWKSQDVVMTKAEWIKLQSAVQKQVRGGLYRVLKKMMDEATHYHSSARKLAGQSPLITLVSKSLGGAEMPSSALESAAIKAFTQFEVDLNTPSWKKLEKSAAAAVKAVPAYAEAVATYEQKLLTGASRAVTTLKVVKVSSFVVFGVLAGIAAMPATPTLATAALASGKAGAISGFVESAASEVGNGVSDPAFRLSYASWNVAKSTGTEAAVGFVTGPMASKVSGLLGKTVKPGTLKRGPLAAKDIAPIAREVGVAGVQKLVMTYMNSGDGKKDLKKAAEKVKGRLTGKENEAKLAAMVADELVRMKVTAKAVKKLGKRKR